MTGVGTMVAAFATVASASDTVISGKWSMTLPVGLQVTSANIPDDNSMNDDKIALGKLLYFDPRFSKDETVSCATCHNPFHGFADSTRTSTGVGGKHGTRNSPTLINRLFSADQFWDGRVKDLEHQVPGALLNPITMAMGSETEVAERVRGIKGYAPLFVKAFGDDTVDVGRISKAIAAYERTLVSGDSPYDRHQDGDKDALSASAIRGLALFTGKANCKTCHTGFNFTDEDYNNIGVGMAKPEPDVGRYAVTKNDADRGKFKTPTLRNVALTAPYMHDGSEETLEDVIAFYDQGGIPNPNLSKEIRPLGLTAQEKQDLVAFLETLTGAVTNASPPKTLPQ